jgi:hypothetical protein
MRNLFFEHSLGEVDFIQGMLDFGNPKNSVGLKPNAELRKDAKAPSYNIGKKKGDVYDFMLLSARA